MLPTHCSITSRDYIRLCPGAGHVAQPHRLGDPRGIQDDDLTPAWVHVLILDAAQRPRTDTCTYHNSVYRRRCGGPIGEEVDTSLDDLIDVLDISADDGSPVRQEAREEVIDVERGLDAVCGV